MLTVRFADAGMKNQGVLTVRVIDRRQLQPCRERRGRGDGAGGDRDV
jgi:hypothetical protein